MWQVFITDGTCFVLPVFQTLVVGKSMFPKGLEFGILEHELQIFSWIPSSFSTITLWFQAMKQQFNSHGVSMTGLSKNASFSFSTCSALGALVKKDVIFEEPPTFNCIQFVLHTGCVPWHCEWDSSQQDWWCHLPQSADHASVSWQTHQGIHSYSNSTIQHWDLTIRLSLSGTGLHPDFTIRLTEWNWLKFRFYHQIVTQRN